MADAKWILHNCIIYNGGGLLSLARDGGLEITIFI